jgi:beta-glucosidase
MIESPKIPNMVLADGPAGLRLTKSFKVDHDGNVIDDQGAFPGMEYIVPDAAKPAIPEDAVTYYQYCTAIPIATLLAQTWDVDVIEEAGDIVGEEMEELGVTLWLAPGMNIHRNPLCGRNFEYYSEYPLVAGRCAAADTIGVQKHRGIGTTIKHFAFNNQEDNRMHTNAHVTERAAREIYLKGFEIAVRTAQPMSIMTSYNLINGTHAANNQDLLTAIARDEWGFAGLVMTDWGTTGGIEMDPGMTFKYGCSTASGCVRAGNDLTMPGSQADVDDIVTAVGNTITLGDLQACAKRILNILMQSSSYEGAKPYFLNSPNDLS